MRLKHTQVKRKPNSVHDDDKFYTATDAVEMYTGYGHTAQLLLEFTASASGRQGPKPSRTDYRVLIDIEEYAAIICAMCEVDEKAALSAMANELAARLKARP